MKMENPPQRFSSHTGKRVLYWLCILVLWTVLVLMASTVQAQEPLVVDPAATQLSAAPAALDNMVIDVLALVNAERAEAGCAPLTNNMHLENAAQGHSQDMADYNYFDHRDRNGGRPADRALAAGYPGSYIGENIAAGYSSAASVVAGWMASQGHRENILHCTYTESGIGVAFNVDSDFRIYWVQLFGRNDTTGQPPGTQPTPQPIEQPAPTPIDNAQAVVYLPVVALPDVVASTCTDPECLSDEFGAALLALLNQRRAAAGCGALTPHSILNEVAYRHTRDMAEHGYVSYLDLNDETPWGRAKAAGYLCTPGHVGIPAGDRNLRTPADAYAYYMRPFLDETILDCSYRHAGIGIYRDPASVHGYYWMLHMDSGANYN